MATSRELSFNVNVISNIGNTHMRYMAKVVYSRSPECQPRSGYALPILPLSIPERTKSMAMEPETKAPPRAASATTGISLADVLNTVEGRQALSATRRRDLRSAVKRVASLLGEDPARILLDLPVLSAKLAAMNPVSAGLTSKTFSNIRSDFVAAVKSSELLPVGRSAKTPLNEDWTRLMARLPGKRAPIGLSRLAHYASALDIVPEQINDTVIENFIAAVRDGSLLQPISRSRHGSCFCMATGDS